MSSTAYTIGFSVWLVVFVLAAAWQVFLLSRRRGSLWRAVVGRPGWLLRLYVALTLTMAVQLVSGGQDSVGAAIGLAVAAAIGVYTGVVWLWPHIRARSAAKGLGH